MLKNGSLLLNCHYLRYRLHSLVLPWNLTFLFHGNQTKAFPTAVGPSACHWSSLNWQNPDWTGFSPWGLRRASHISVLSTKWRKENLLLTLLTISHHHPNLLMVGAAWQSQTLHIASQINTSTNILNVIVLYFHLNKKKKKVRLHNTSVHTLKYQSKI